MSLPIADGIGSEQLAFNSQAAAVISASMNSKFMAKRRQISKRQIQPVELNHWLIKTLLS